MKHTLCLLFAFIICESIYSQSCDLPSQFPTDPIELEEANRLIAECFAPTIHQMTERGTVSSPSGLSDLITGVFYDGDFTTTNNWESLDDFEGDAPFTLGDLTNIDQLDPKVYYSIIWTDDYWIVTYAFYHPRDWSVTAFDFPDILCTIDFHENDMEGAILLVERENQFIHSAHTISHGNLLDFDLNPTESNAIPHIFIDNRGHAVEASSIELLLTCIDDDTQLGNCDNCYHFVMPHVTYDFANGADPFVDAEEWFQLGGDLINGIQIFQGIEGNGLYSLEDIFGLDQHSLHNHKGDPDVFTDDDKFFASFDVTFAFGKASAPWAWTQMMYTRMELESTYGIDFNVIHNPYHPNPCPANIMYAETNDCSSEIMFYENSMNDPTSWNWSFPGGTPGTSTEENPIVTYDVPGVYNVVLVAGNSNEDCEVTLQGEVNVVSPYVPEANQNCYTCYNIPTETIIIDQSMDFTESRVHGNLVIASGATLTINSVVEFTPMSRLIIENGGNLIIDGGGLLTKCGGEFTDSWQGIQLGSDIDNTVPGNLGGNPASIEIKNGGIIEYANVGINNQLQVTNSVGSGPLSGTSTSISSGGEISMTANAEVRHCDIGISFGPRGLSSSINSTPESSLFDEAIFRSNEVGMKLMRNHGLQLSNNSFVDNVTGILAVNSNMTVDDNLFSNAVGITIEGVTPSFYGVNVINNQFYDANAIFINGIANGDEINILNNQVFSSGWGVLDDGLTHFSILNNDFYDAYYGNTFTSTGDFQVNLVEENAFYANYSANRASYANDIEFLTNCFDNSAFADINIPIGKIHIAQGTDEDAASNCFSNYPDLGHHKIVTGYNADFFTYFTKDGYQNPQSCKYPDPLEDESNFEVKLSDEEIQGDCGTGINIFGSISPSYRDCIVPNNNAGRITMINFINAEIDRIENNLPDDDGNIATGYFKKWLLAKYRRCLDKIRKVITGDIIRGNDPIEAVRFLESQGDPRSLIIAYGLLIDIEAYDDAQLLLSSIPTTDNEYLNFVKIQNIYLDYLNDPNSFILDQSDKVLIRTVGIGEGTLTGFARAIYYDLTGIRIAKDYDEVGHNTNSRNSTVNSDDYTQELKVFPNPNSTDLLNLSFEHDHLDDDAIRYNIYDLTGKSVLVGNLMSTSAILDISSLSHGVYFVEVKANYRKLISKFIKL